MNEKADHKPTVPAARIGKRDVAPLRLATRGTQRSAIVRKGEHWVSAGKGEGFAGKPIGMPE